MLVLSDLFAEPGQFQWMFDHFSHLQKVHPMEDEMLHNLLRIGICKSIAVLAISDPDVLERTRKSLEMGLKAANLPTRMGCLQGILYLFQCENPEVSSEVMNHILPAVLGIKLSLIFQVFVQQCSWIFNSYLIRFTHILKHLLKFL